MVFYVPFGSFIFPAKIFSKCFHPRKMLFVFLVERKMLIRNSEKYSFKTFFIFYRHTLRLPDLLLFFATFTILWLYGSFSNLCFFLYYFFMGYNGFSTLFGTWKPCITQEGGHLKLFNTSSKMGFSFQFQQMQWVNLFISW